MSDATDAEIHVQNSEPVSLPDLDQQPAPGAPPSAGEAHSAAGGSTPSAPAAEPLPVAVVADMVSAGFDLLAARRGEHWQLDAAEADNIAEPLAGELNDLLAHAPFLGGAVGALGGRRVQLVVALGWAVGPRLLVDASLGEAERVEAVRAAMPGNVRDLPRQPEDQEVTELADRLSRIPQDEPEGA
jgi:hypothetical protein